MLISPPVAATMRFAVAGDGYDRPAMYSLSALRWRPTRRASSVCVVWVASQYRRIGCIAFRVPDLSAERDPG